jgi:hypothetical protein
MHHDNPTEPGTAEVPLPGGWVIAFDSRPNAISAGSADPNNPNAGAMGEKARFVLRPAGAPLEGFELQVTTRPMIGLVWIGALLIFFGGLVGMRRRIAENRALPIPDLPDPAPKAPAILPRRRAKSRAASAKPAPSLAAAGKTSRDRGS